MPVALKKNSRKRKYPKRSLLPTGSRRCGEATPEIDAEQAAEEPIPGWMGADSEVSSQAIGGPQGYEQDIPDWLRETSAPLETAEEPPVAQAEDEGVPDWLKGLGAAAAGAAALSALTPEESTEPAPERPATDWLSALRRATPEIDAEQAAEETVPGWMGTDSEVSSQAIGGPQAYDQDIPDWLREETAPGAPERPAEDEGTPDWLKGLGAALLARVPWQRPSGLKSRQMKVYLTGCAKQSRHPS